MRVQRQYGTTAKLLHWTVVALVAVQFSIGWFMPDVHRGMLPGNLMSLHISVGLVILALTVVRLGWRLTHPVAPDASLPNWQRRAAEALHWLLYFLVLVTTISGWMFASMRGWAISFFFIAPVPMLTAAGSPVGRAIGQWHSTAEWALLIAVGFHVAAALAHIFVYRDRVMQRMLPGSR